MVGHTAAATVSRPRRRRLAGAVASAAAVILVATGGVVGVRLWAGSTGALPEDVVPASTAAFARINLSPGFGQRLKLAELVERFPGEGSAEERIDEIRRKLIESTGEELSGLDLDLWLGDRLGIGVWPDAGEPVLLVVAASRDDRAATRALTEKQRAMGVEKLGFVLADGYVLMAVGETAAQTAAEQAAAEARRGSLSDSDAFGSVRDKLPGDETFLGWADLDRIGELVKDAAAEESDRLADSLETVDGLGGSIPGWGIAGLGANADRLTGKIIFGVRAADNGVEARVRLTGVAPRPQGVADARAELDGLPVSSLAAGAVADEELGEALGDLAETGLTLAGSLAHDQLSRETPGPAEPGRAVMSFVNALRATNVLGIALSNADSKDPALMVRLRTADANSAATLAEAWQTLGGRQGPMPAPLTASQDGNVVEFATAGYRADGGRLGDAVRYREAMADMPDRPQGALFVDVQGLLADTDVPPEDARMLAPVKAIAAAAGSDGDDTVGMLRIVIQ